MRKPELTANFSSPRTISSVSTSSLCRTLPGPSSCGVPSLVTCAVTMTSDPSAKRSKPESRRHPGRALEPSARPEKRAPLTPGRTRTGHVAGTGMRPTRRRQSMPPPTRVAAARRELPRQFPPQRPAQPTAMAAARPGRRTAIHVRPQPRGNSRPGCSVERSST